MGSGKGKVVVIKSRYQDAKFDNMEDYVKDLRGNKVLAERKSEILSQSNTLRGDRESLNNSISLLNTLKIPVNVDYDRVFYDPDLRKKLGEKDTQIIRNINQTLNVAHSILEEFNNVFPESTKLSLKGIAFGDENFDDEDNYHGFYSPLKNTISISQHLVDSSIDKNEFQDEYNIHSLSDLGGYHVDVITHEIGHYIHHVLSNKFMNNMDKDFDKAYKKYADTIHVSVNKNGSFDENGSLSMLAVTPYGNYNKLEAFSEAFTLYTTGEDSVVGNEYFTVFKSFMKDMGLEKFKGMNRYVSNPVSKTSNTISYSVDGKIHTSNISDTAKKRGYVVAIIQGVKYSIDTQTGVILNSKREVK